MNGFGGDQPDHPHQVQDPGQHDGDRVRWREALNARHPALHHVSEAGEHHQAACEARDPGRAHDRGREQEQREAQREILIAPQPPLEPADCLGAGEARRLLGVRSARPRVHRLLEGDPVHGHYGAVQRQCHRGQNGAESSRPSRRFSLNVQSEEQGEQPREQDRHGGELAEMHGRPDRVGSVRGENGVVVIRLPTGVEQGDHDVQELSHQQQRAGKAQRRASECSVVHDRAPCRIHRTTSKCAIIPAAWCSRIWQ